ncbi:conserved hypothetical protein [Verticillium alfalfae VaMs.102]|uniref:AMP-dependent synthetase/ligase domain-containing protein n=1 Tax=Verticillium alfalfae (strain VaMs.102 / ATCC MYA-4576 / FGSC 10136) TaxID=526221 RepID=C9S970_VERA1|nr:conserved hypothetical protein [Verticillium alfalfae VaMs.102]EEY14118.1 conserved hypothetical protein [Verticillium alfalfae VaMs.102]
MGTIDNLLVSLDQSVTGLFGQWNSYTTAMVTFLVIIVSYRIAASQEPDTHPMLLARQAQGSPVRQEGESPVYRAHASPHGMPLNSGLNVKDSGASKWSRGRDGDLRDIWRRAAGGTPDEDGKPASGKGRLLTVHGARQVIEANIDDVTRQINLIGQHIHEQGGIRVAIYLPNSIELIAALFACSFYSNLTAILIPFDVSDEELISMLRRSAADTVVTAPGAFPFDAVVKAYPSLRQLIWVVDEGSKHMDWNEVPEGMGGSVNVATWQEIVQEAPAAAGLELPPVAGQHEPADIITFWQSRAGTMEEMVRFSQANLIAGIAAQLAALPVSQRLGPSDLFLPVDSLTNTHRADGYCASPETLLKTHHETTSKLTSALARLSYWLKSRSLVDYGIMPVASVATSFGDAYLPAIGTTPGKLRVVYTAERVGAHSVPLSPRELSDLRVFLGARVIYALTASKVAGAVTQTGYYDYRVHGQDSQRSHFGPPVTSTEILLRDTADLKTTDEVSQGQIIVRGPSVAGGEAALGVFARMSDDNTVSYV